MRVSQSIAVSPAHDNDATFTSFGMWVGTVGGSALPTDPDPNVTPPSNARIVRWTGRGGNMLAHGFGSFKAVIPPVAASSITLRLWVYDDTIAQWIPLITTTTAPTGAAGGVTLAPTALPGSKLFLQITANTNVQAISYGVA
jgi:hypothetical protein